MAPGGAGAAHDIAIQSFMLAMLCEGAFALLRPDLVAAAAFPTLASGDPAYDACVRAISLVGVYSVALGLMTCPAPHGYWMSSLALIAGTARHLLATRPSMFGVAGAHIGILIAIAAFATAAVIGHGRRAKDRKAR